jgi:hypothetical protein
MMQVGRFFLVPALINPQYLSSNFVQKKSIIVVAGGWCRFFLVPALIPSRGNWTFLSTKKKRKINDDITITPFQDVILVLTRMKKRQKTTKSFKGACGLWLGVLNDYNGHESSELY